MSGKLSQKKENYKPSDLFQWACLYLSGSCPTSPQRASRMILNIFNDDEWSFLMINDAHSSVSNKLFGVAFISLILQGQTGT